MKITDKAKRKELTQMRRKQILDAATEVFSKKGFANADGDEIAKLAKLGKGTIYRYFKTKKNLFLSVVDKGIDALKDFVLEEMTKGKDSLDKITIAISAYLYFFEQAGDLMGILIHEQSAFQKRIQKRYFEHYYGHINKLEKIFQEGIAKGQIKKIDVKDAIGVLTNMLNGLVYMWQLEGRKYHLRDKLPMVLEIYFRGIVKDRGGRKNRKITK